MKKAERQGIIENRREGRGHTVVKFTNGSVTILPRHGCLKKGTAHAIIKAFIAGGLTLLAVAVYIMI